MVGAWGMSHFALLLKNRLNLFLFFFLNIYFLTSKWSAFQNRLRQADLGFLIFRKCSFNIFWQGVIWRNMAFLCLFRSRIVSYTSVSENIGISHGFSCNDICRVPRKLFEHEAASSNILRGTRKMLLQWNNHGWSLSLHNLRFQRQIVTKTPQSSI